MLCRKMLGFMLVLACLTRLLMHKHDERFVC